MTVTLPAEAEAYDSSAHLRWHLSTPPRGLVALGVDLGGNTLLVLDGAPESGARAGLWIDAQGNATPPFPIGALSRSAGATLFARIGQGFFVRQTLSSGNEWLGQLDALSSTLASIPDWLAPEKKALIHVIKGGAGYALLPPPGVAVSPCAQQVSIVDPSGLDCGSLSFPLGPDSCVTDAITLGRDGTVIQLLPAALESQAAIPSPSCTWQWWSAFLK